MILLKIIKKILLIIVFILPFAAITLISLMKAGYISLFHNFQNFSVISDMDFSPAKKSQSESKFFPDSMSFRIPPAGTIPVDGNIYPFAMEEFAKAESLFVNPLKPDKEILERGKNRYEIFCSHCHGFTGKGDGSVMTKVTLKEGEEPFPGPPDYSRPETKAFSDARIFHIISAGQNIMFPLADRISVYDRWAIVLYVRKLQGLNK